MTQYEGYFGREVPIFWRVKEETNISESLYLPDKVRRITSRETRNSIAL